MNLDLFPDDIREHILPSPKGDLVYRCLGCGQEHPIYELLYTCPTCGQVLLIYDKDFDRLKDMPPEKWRRLFDFRRLLKIPALKGIYRFHEFIGPVLPLESIIYLGEGHTPQIEANASLQSRVGLRFYFKNDGQNPSASFKDRGMASALSYIHYLIREEHIADVLAICASTGDTSAAAALYASYLNPLIRSAVLLPHKKVTPQQLSQPLGSGAAVYEIPGVFDDCMKVVENLSENYNVALLNSKNAWRILGQESYSYEIAQEFDWELSNLCVVVPIGNAGNITAVLNGFLKFYDVGIIQSLPKIIGVQSEHADPVYQYYREPDPGKRSFKPVTVKSSVAQAAMIGNPVSMPRVVHLVEKFNELAGQEKVFFVQVAEQDIMDWQLEANRNGHISCTHGGECLAGLVTALQKGLIASTEIAVLDSTAHALKFAGFQEMYFENQFPPDYHVVPNPQLMNFPKLVKPEDLAQFPQPGNPLEGDDLDVYVKRIAADIAHSLELKSKLTA
jgi:threonine synthase